MGDVIHAFTADHVERLTGLSTSQLRDWDRTGFFAPTFAFENRRSPYSRVYSFKDVVGLKTLSILRKTHRVPMAHLREVARALSAVSGAPFADLKLYVVNREVHVTDPDTAALLGIASGQAAMPLLLKDVWNDVRREAAALKERSAKQIGQVERHRFRIHDTPAVAGTRIPVSAIKSLSEDGYSCEQILAEYPLLTARDVRAALAYDHDIKLTA
jgi:uncharacterized protein (DUF433 family)